MQAVEHWHWWITDPRTGLHVMSALPMTAAQALALDASAKPVYGTLQRGYEPAADADDWRRQA